MKRLALCLFCVAICTQLPAQNVAQNFQNPPKAYRPMVRWWWPGCDVTDAELRKEVDLLDRANFGGAEIQPFNIGLNPNMSRETLKRVNDYLTPTFFAHVKAALEEAQAHGMWLDYTFGSGWPFGGAGVITPELATVELKSAHQTIRGPVHFHGKLQMPEPNPDVARVEKSANLPKGWAEGLRKREKLVAVVAVRGDSVQYYPSQSATEKPIVKTTGQLAPGSSIVLTDRMQPDGTLDWNVPSGTWQVFTFKEIPRGLTVTGGVGVGPQLVMDHMNRKAFDVYAQRVGGTTRQYVGQYFGHSLRAIFVDSLEVRANLYWDDDFLDQFRKLRGYDLTPYLPLLKVPGMGVSYSATAAHMPLYNMKGIGDRVRRDYRQTISDVMVENFYAPFDQWAANNHLLSRVQAHGSPTDQIRVYGAASIPETEDLYDNGRYDFLKMASSSADLYGRKIVSSESFVWHGKVYQTTPEKIKRFADELLTAGINEIIYHGFPYRYMDRPFPGWHPFATGYTASSDMNRTNPFWPYLPRLNEYITRVQYISQIGTTVAPVALYRAMLAYDEIQPMPPEPEINTRLMAAGYNFDHIDAYAVLQCHVADGKLVSPGGATYRALVLPEQKAVSEKVANQLLAFAKLGLPIVFVGQVPTVQPTVVEGRLPTGDSNALDGEIKKFKSVRVVAAPADAVRSLDTTGVQPNLRFDGPSVPFIEKRIGKLDAFFLRNPDDAPKTVKAEFTASGTPELWDPWTGVIKPLASFNRQGSLVHVQLDMDAYGSKLLVFNPAAKPTATPAPISNSSQTPVQVAVGRNGWKFHGVGIGPGSQPETVDMELPQLVDWSMNDRLKNFSGRGQYTTAFTVPVDLLAGKSHIVLDLGDVQDVAEISIDGKAGPILLMRPYKADVTRWVHPGENTLQVTVTNTLYNALSAQGPSANYAPETTNTPNGLMPSGMIGPVRLEETKWK